MVLFKKSDLKRILKGHCERKLSGDKVRLELLEQFQLGRENSREQGSSLSSSSVYSD